MKRTMAVFVLLVTGSAAYANCIRDGARTQSVALVVDGRQIDRWDIQSSGIHRVRLPHGFDLGLQIEPATAEKYRELLAKTGWRAVDELVKITLLDMAREPPAELSTTWGGANSQQGFGPRGGANGVPRLTDQIELQLRHPVCVGPDTMADR